MIEPIVDTAKGPSPVCRHANQVYENNYLLVPALGYDGPDLASECDVLFTIGHEVDSCSRVAPYLPVSFRYFLLFQVASLSLPCNLLPGDHLMQSAISVRLQTSMVSASVSGSYGINPVKQESRFSVGVIRKCLSAGAVGVCLMCFTIYLGETIPFQEDRGREKRLVGATND